MGKHPVIRSNVQIGGANEIGERVEPGMIFMGNPARVIRKKRGPQYICKKSANKKSRGK